KAPRQGLDPAAVDASHRHPPKPRRLEQLGGHDPVGRLLRQAAAREDREACTAGAGVVTTGLVAQPDVREKTAEQRDADIAPLAGPAGFEVDFDVAGGRAQPLNEVLPLADAQIVDVLAPERLAELAARK